MVSECGPKRSPGPPLLVLVLFSLSLSSAPSYPPSASQQCHRTCASLYLPAPFQITTCCRILSARLPSFVPTSIPVTIVVLKRGLTVADVKMAALTRRQVSSNLPPFPLPTLQYLTPSERDTTELGRRGCDPTGELGSGPVQLQYLRLVLTLQSRTRSCNRKMHPQP